MKLQLLIALAVIAMVNCTYVWDDAIVYPELQPYGDEYPLELDPIPASFRKLLLATRDEIPYDLTGCNGNECMCCFRVWKFKGCFKATLESNGITMTIELFGKTVYTKTIRKGSQSFLIRINKSKMPRFIRKQLNQCVFIMISGIDLEKKTICFQFEATVKLIGKIKWPRSSPKCVTV